MKGSGGGEGACVVAFIKEARIDGRDFVIGDCLLGMSLRHCASIRGRD